MPKVQLSSGQGFVSIAHGYVQVVDGWPYNYEWVRSLRAQRDLVSTRHTKWSIDNYRAYEMERGTRIVVELPNGDRVEALSVCKPPDRFVRLIGRQMAGRRLAKKLEGVTTYSDREAIFKIVFPDKPKPKTFRSLNEFKREYGLEDDDAPFTDEQAAALGRRLMQNRHIVDIDIGSDL